MPACVIVLHANGLCTCQLCADCGENVVDENVCKLVASHRVVHAPLVTSLVVDAGPLGILRAPLVRVHLRDAEAADLAVEVSEICYRIEMPLPVNSIRGVLKE